MATGFCILGPVLTVVGLQGDFDRGIIGNEEVCMYISETARGRERQRLRKCFSGPFGQCEINK